MSVRAALERLVAGVDGYVATGCPDELVAALEAARVVLAEPVLQRTLGSRRPQLEGPEARGVAAGQQWRNRRTGRVSTVRSVYLRETYGRRVAMVAYVSTAGSSNTGAVSWFLEAFEPVDAPALGRT